MREIKFRAWDEKNKVMHYDFEFIRSGIEGNDWIIFKSDKQPLDWERIRLEKTTHPFNNPYFSQQLKIMQFTGLHDKNGKDIYEGDVLKVFFSAYAPKDCQLKSLATLEGWNRANKRIIGLQYDIHIVEWQEYSAQFVGKMVEKNPHSEYHQSRIINLYTDQSCEIIGNIYENPELIK